jgi:hypothetical protein
MSKQFYPETDAERETRLNLPTEEQRMDFYSIIKDLSYPPGDVRRYGANSEPNPEADGK